VRAWDGCIAQARSALQAAAILIYQGTQTYPPSSGPLPTAPPSLYAPPPTTAMPTYPQSTLGPGGTNSPGGTNNPGGGTLPPVPTAGQDTNVAALTDLPSLLTTLVMSAALAGVAWL